MAHLAAQSHKSGMDFRFLVTGRTHNLAFLERLSLVAIGADQFSMLASELKYRGMVKIRHTVNPVVATGARAAKRSYVAGHKVGILECVAFLAGKGRRVVGKSSVALQTGNGITAKTGRMHAHRKTGLLMVEWLSLPGGWQPGLPFMALTAIIGKDPGMHSRFLMAGGAFGTGHREYLGMALLAGRFGMTFIDREVGNRVIEILPSKLNRFKFPTTVIRMAVPALYRIRHIAVNTGAAGQLCANILVAFRAQAGLITA